MENTTTTRKYFVGGNWKCNGTMKFVHEFTENTLNKMDYKKDKMGKILFSNNVVVINHSFSL